MTGPTTEHLSTAMQLITQHSTHGADARIDFADAIARALAAAVQQERDKVLAVADGLDEVYEVHHKNWRSNGSTYAEGVSAGLGLASDRIREVSR